MDEKVVNESIRGKFIPSLDAMTDESIDVLESKVVRIIRMFGTMIIEFCSMFPPIAVLFEISSLIAGGLSTFGIGLFAMKDLFSFARTNMEMLNNISKSFSKLSNVGSEKKEEEEKKVGEKVEEKEERENVGEKKEKMDGRNIIQKGGIAVLKHKINNTKKIKKRIYNSIRKFRETRNRNHKRIVR